MAQAPTVRGTENELRLLMGYDEFLNSAYAESHAEWVNGEVTVFMPPSTRHMQLARFLAVVFSLYVETLELGEVLFAPFEMRLRPDRSFREPDILFVAKEHLGRLESHRLNGPADLVVEIVSPDRVYRDRADKFFEYQAAGIPEYLLLDPRPGMERVDFFQLDLNGRYQPVLPDDAGRYSLATLPGFWLDAAWLLREPLPKATEALATIAPDRFGMPTLRVERGK